MGIQRNVVPAIINSKKMIINDNNGKKINNPKKALNIIFQI